MQCSEYNLGLELQPLARRDVHCSKSIALDCLIACMVDTMVLIILIIVLMCRLAHLYYWISKIIK